MKATVAVSTSIEHLLSETLVRPIKPGFQFADQRSFIKTPFSKSGPDQIFAYRLYRR